MSEDKSSTVTGKMPPNLLYKSPEYTNRRISEVLPDGSWRGKPAFIVGGGPSLSEFDCSRLKGRRTIGVNLAFLKFDPTVIFSMDTRCLNWILSKTYDAKYPGCLARFNASAAYKVWLLTYVASLREDVFIAPVYRNYESGLKGITFNSAEGICHGNNSGYGALNLALCLGANPIYLLGFDMRHVGDRTHWHKGHPVPQPKAHVDGFVKYFQAAAPKIKARGIRIVNLTPGSALDCFEMGDAGEALHDN